MMRMEEGTSIQFYLHDFNTVLFDLEHLDIKMNDEDKVVLLVYFLPPSHRHFKETMLS